MVFWSMHVHRVACPTSDPPTASAEAVFEKIEFTVP
jgi:hypothetical protein